MISGLLSLFKVATVNRAVLEGAVSLGFDDFEDAILHEAGRLSGATSIVACDPTGFPNATLRIYAPETLAAALEAGE